MRVLKNILLILALMLSVSHAKSFTKTKYVKVTKRYKTYIWKTKRVPYQSCYYESVPVKYTEYVDVYERNPAAPILGGVVGGVIGHQFGKGRGKDLATVVGAIAGGTLANKHYGRKHYRRPVTRVRYEQRQVCSTYYKTKRYKVRRWKNIAYYKGRRIVKTSKYRLRKIPVKIRVSY
jgi:uncharacterized protein YcfJ